MNYANRTMSHNQYNPPDLPMVSAKEQTLMWQQNSYLSDSGIQSGAVTQVPSLSGRDEDDMDNDPLMYDLDQGFPQNFTQDKVDDMNQQLSQTLEVFIFYFTYFVSSLIIAIVYTFDCLFKS